MKWWQELFRGITGPGFEYLAQRKKLKYDLKLKKIEGEIKVAEAEANRQIKLLETDHQWELMQLQKQGWKDDWVLILLSIPLIMSFIPPLQPFVFGGFQILATTPEWYRWLIMLIFTAIYGIRIWRRKNGS